MADPDRILFVIETLPGARAQVSVNIPTPHPGMHLATPAHALAIDALGWLGKQPAVAGFVYSPDLQNIQPLPLEQAHQQGCADLNCGGCMPTKAAHIVLDLETLSTQPNAAIASIGAVALTARGSFVSEFHVAVDAGAPQHLRHVCANTCAWWDKQSEDAKLGSIHAPNPTLPHQALEAFTAWVQQHADPKKVKVWGNGSSFDNVILSSLYADYPELVRPWAYWNDRDMRTVLDLHPQAKNVGEFEGIKHNALHDARHEAKQLVAVLRATPAAGLPAAAPDTRGAFPAMTPQLHSILGLMCFQCIPFAQALRAAGHQIKSRAEDEQAAVLHWMLGHYFRHGEEWRTAAAADVERMKAAAIAAQAGNAEAA